MILYITLRMTAPEPSLWSVDGPEFLPNFILCLVPDLAQRQSCQHAQLLLDTLYLGVMITPRFSCSQDAASLTVSMHCPAVRVRPPPVSAEE
jgi:hypothetical protein